MLLRITTTLFMALALVAPSLHADHHESKQGKVSALMARIESNALDMREQAARLRTYNRAPQLHSWEIHADELGRISAELGNISALVKDLKPMKPFMTFRQNTAFNHIVTLSGAVSTVTGNAIKLVNTEREKLQVAHPDCEKKVDAIYDHADQIAAHADSVESWADFFEDLQDATDE